MTPEQLNAFVDGELDLAGQLQAERDPALHAPAAQLRELSRLVRSQADYHRAPDALRERLRRCAAAATAPPAAARRRRWSAWQAGGASAFATALLAVGLHLALAPDDGRRLQDEAVASHVRASLSQRSIDVASSDQHTVKPWLSARLDYSPPVQHPQAAGAVLVGGRVDALAGRPVAVLVYRLRQHEVDVFVWPAGDRPPPAVAAAQRGFNLAGSTGDGMAWLAVSDVNAGELSRLVRVLAGTDGAAR